MKRRKRGILTMTAALIFLFGQFSWVIPGNAQRMVDTCSTAFKLVFKYKAFWRLQEIVGEVAWQVTHLRPKLSDRPRLPADVTITREMVRWCVKAIHRLIVGRHPRVSKFFKTIIFRDSCIEWWGKLLQESTDVTMAEHIIDSLQYFLGYDNRQLCYNYLLNKKQPEQNNWKIYCRLGKIGALIRNVDDILFEPETSHLKVIQALEKQFRRFVCHFEIFNYLPSDIIMRVVETSWRSLEKSWKESNGAQHTAMYFILINALYRADGESLIDWICNDTFLEELQRAVKRGVLRPTDITTMFNAMLREKKVLGVFDDLLRDKLSHVYLDIAGRGGNDQRQALTLSR